MSPFSHFLQQSFFIPKPPLTEHSLPDQTGRVFIVTGGYNGVGLALVRILYQRNGTVYIAGRSDAKAAKAITDMKAEVPSVQGRLEFMKLDLSDLTTIKGAVQTFLDREKRLDVLINNAGVMSTPIGSKSAQGHELQAATNILGAYLLTKLLLPILQETARTSPPGTVRVSFAGSIGIDVAARPAGGIDLTEDGAPIEDAHDPQQTYGQTKVANLFLGSQFAVRHSNTGVIFNSFNPGNLHTDLGRHLRMNLFWYIIIIVLLYPPIFGAYTELWAGWSEEAGRPEANGGYVWPWGRLGGARADVQAEVEMGKHGEGKAVRLWEWCERVTREYQ
ncbi:hypothetical protein BAUCODRAFT_99688 [Baudoinia panamericana UAMH 10762]|uniref:NAD(P)-binding protein n=1 Tax=Baudoinia panamericana (strain UAMH 10762) TaxID=717646 RepID=M2M0D1_BAUPA|nr:uncharacterized protein BAUCODRAFT_99688 [Baudoinia panamericana UAMH 10762]EMD00458.1 hypothetical protein BAUCODRAFT_99688 [Baudoinia panamericana UAMH 10762]